MREVPASIPVTTPLPSTMATPVALLLHEPPAVLLLTLMLLFLHTCVAPDIDAGLLFTTTDDTVRHDVGSVYVMFVIPKLTPVTTPLVLFTVATPGVLLVHIPPVVLLPSAVVMPTHTFRLPVAGDGSAFTLTVDIRIQPVASVYVMRVVPAFRPVTTPPDVIEATDVLPLSHVPPTLLLFSVIVFPWHTIDGPVVLFGSGFTTTVALLRQPVGIVYVISALPADKPLTSPVALTPAVPGAPLLHTPPGVALSSCVVPLTHTCVLPLTEAGSGFTTTSFVR